MNIKDLQVRTTPTGIFVKSNGSKFRLTNFSCQIVSETKIIDTFDNVSMRLALDLEMMGEKQQITMPIEEFYSKEWLLKHLGTDIKINTKVNHKELCEIIIKASKYKTKSTEIEKIGLNIVNGIPTFLHNEGAITAQSDSLINIKATPEGHLKNCNLPELADKDNKTKFVKQFLNICNISKTNPSCGTLLFASIVRSPLTHFIQNSVVGILAGKTGTFKTSIALIGQASYGKDITEPLGNWNSTAKSTELLAQQANNIYLLIDDFTASHANKETAALLEYVIGGAANHTSHGYAISSTKAGTPPPINAFIIMTVEVIPPMEVSRKARCIISQMLEGDIDINRLTKYQEYAENGNYSKVTRLYVEYILDNYDFINKHIKDLFKKYRSKAAGELNNNLHNRASSNVADLAIGIRYFLKFCADNNYISKDDELIIMDTQWSILINITNSQPAIYNSLEPKYIAEEELSLLFKSSSFNICKLINKTMTEECDIEDDDFLGWYSPEDRVFYINSSFNTTRIVELLPENIRPLINSGPKSFWVNMKRYGLLAEVDRSSGKNYVRRTISGSKYCVYSLKYSLIGKH